jgi:hypothetical protein
MIPILRLGSGEEIRDPSPEDVERSLRSMPEGDGSTVILQRDDARFMQTAWEPREGFIVLEYNDGSADLHFQCLSGLEKERVIRAFLRYLDGYDDYKRDFDWKPLHRHLIVGARPLMKVVVIAIVAFVCWLLVRSLLR